MAKSGREWRARSVHFKRIKGIENRYRSNQRNRVDGEKERYKSIDMQMSNIYARYLRRHGGQNGCKHQLASVRETCVWHPWGPPAR